MAATKPKPRKTRKGMIVPQKHLETIVGKVEKSLREIQSRLQKYTIGDTVRVHVKIKEDSKSKEGGKDKKAKTVEKERIQIFEGIVIARSNRGVSRTFTVRKISHGVGVERIFLETSPHVTQIEVMQKGKIRRAKLYYLREREGKAARLEKDVGSRVSPKAGAVLEEGSS